uniref:RNA-directed DNA polymerase, eukaryota n=1 Tax=Tanacetum cinerariifolium TaxID=118510 RepID=A0A6L2N1W2_TANCI|nr:RNA-directed DNA polymerase, eukaryota [Tanacetum cinerariifolium]
MVRAKELFTWTLCFLEYKDAGYILEDESILGDKNNTDNPQQDNGARVGESKDEGVSDTIFRNNPQSPCNHGYDDSLKADVQHSEDPFGFYDLLKKPPNNFDNLLDPSLSHRSGFTPKGNSKVKPNSQDLHANESSSEFSTRIHSHTTLNRGSIFKVLDDMIKVGQSMGYDMEGLGHKTKEWVKELNYKHGINFLALQETKMDCISHMDVKFIWGNSNYQFVASGSVGNSGGILCVWEESIFKKDNVSVSGNFIALYRTWLLSDTKILRVSCIRDFNHFISSSGLLEVKMEGYSFTWLHPSATKMSKLDRFLVSEGIILTFPAITAVYLDHHLSDHRPIILNEIHTDFGPNPFWIFHSWRKRDGFDAMVEQADTNLSHVGTKNAILKDLGDIDKNLDNGVPADEMLAKQGVENSKFFHGIINKRRSQLAIRGVFVSGDWHTEPSLVKDTFLDHFAARFKQPLCSRVKLSMTFPNRLSSDQIGDLDKNITMNEIDAVVWDCGENNSPGCNSSFIALIPKVVDAKFVTDFRPISLIGSVYKVVTRILANRLARVISDLVSNTQSTFVANRQILDSPFILNEVLTWCKRKRKQALVFKVNFPKAYDSIRWDFLLDVLQAFGFGPRWCTWICGIFSSNMASILVNGSPSAEFPICYGLKQGDPLAPLFLILVMESFHISVSRAVNDGVFKGLQIQGSVSLSRLFYADDAVFIGEWSDDNLDNLIRILKCFHLASGLRINVNKSYVLGVRLPTNIVQQGASCIGCDIMQMTFKYFRVMVGDHMSRYTAWSNSIQKVQARLSKWKVKTLSVGGRLTLFKSFLGAVPIYNMSIYKALISVLHEMEMFRNKFFNGGDSQVSKITWVTWDKVLTSMKKGGLGVSSFYALNHALLLKWVWRFLSQDGSLWFQMINAIYGSRFESHSHNIYSTWCCILRELQVLDSKGFDFLSHCKIRVKDRLNTRFWLDTWILDMPLSARFPRIFALENDIEASVAAQWGASLFDASFQKPVRDGAESHQWTELMSMLGTISLSSSPDRWVCDLNGDGVFRVKDISSTLDDLSFLLRVWPLDG